MYDIHSHVLPGLDDGAKTFDDSVALLEMAAEDGTTHIVGTPHCNYQYEYSLERNLELARQLQQQLGGRITLLTGCDFHLSYENLERVVEEPSRYTLNQGRYLLTEFSTHGIPPGIENQLHQLRLKRLVPVITHPERVPELMRDRFELLVRLAEMGCPIQVTAGSLSGQFGEPAREASQRLLNWKMVRFVASDAHNIRGRTPRLSDARRLVAEEFGEEVAEALFTANPRAAIESQPLPFDPEPAEPPRKRRFWFF